MVETELVVKIASGGAGQTVRDVLGVQQAIAKLGKDAKDTAALAKALGSAFNLPDDQVRDLADALGQAKDETDKLAKSAGALDKIFTGFFESLGRKGLDVAIASFRQLGQAIQDTIGKASQEFGQFDAALTSFSAKSGIARGELQALEEEAIRLAAVTSQTPATVAELGTALLTLGASADQAVDRLEAITKLSDVIGEDPVLTGKVVQTALTIYEDFGETAEGVADKIQTLINTTAAGSSGGVGEFFQLFQTAAPAAKALGVDLDDLSAAFATLRDTGASAEVASTGLKIALQSLAGARQRGAKEFKELGLEVFNTAGEFVGLQEALRQFEEATRNLSVEERFQKAVRVFGEGAPAVLSILDQIDKKYTTTAENLANSTGSVAESLEVINQGVERQRELLEGQLSGAYTKLGQAIAPINLALTQFASELLKVTTEGSAGLSGLQEAGDRLRVVLTQNPEIVERLGAALTKVADAGVRQLELLIDAITNFVAEQDNIDLIAQSIEDLALVVTALGQAARFVVVLASQFSVLKDRLDNFPVLGQVLGLDSGPISAVRDLIGVFEFLQNAVRNVAEFMATLVSRFDVLAQNPAIKALTSQILEVDASVDGLGESLSTGLSSAAAGLAAAGAEVQSNLHAVGDSAEDAGDRTAAAAETIEEALKRLGAANKASLSELQTTAANARAAILEAGGDPAQLAAAEAKVLQDRLAANKTFLAELKALQSDALGEDDAAALADQIRGVEQALANDRVAIAQQTVAEKRRLEQEATRAAEEAERARLKAVQDGAALQIAALRLLGEQRAALISQEIQAAQDQLALLSADQGLAAASLELGRERLETALAQAEAAGDAAEAERLRGEIAAINAQAVAQEFEFKRQQLEIEGAIAAAEAQRAVVLADIAVREAEINLTKAQGLKASEQEIENLKAIIALRRQDADSARTAVAVTAELQGLKAGRLDIEQAIAEENQKQVATQKAATKAQAVATAGAQEENIAKKSTADLSRQIAETEERRASALLSALRSQQKSNEEALKELNLVRERFKEAQKAGLFQGQGAEFEAAAKELERILGRGGSLKDLIKFAQDTESDIAKQLLSAIGRGDVLQLIDADEQLKLPLEQGAETAGQTLEDALVRGAERGAAVLAGAVGGRVAGARRDGGPVRGGSTYLVGEEGPELVTMRRGGYVHTARETAAMLGSMGRGRGLVLPQVGGQGEVVAKLDELIRTVKKRPPVLPQATYNLSTPDPVQAAVGLQLEQLRGLVRMGRL